MTKKWLPNLVNSDPPLYKAIANALAEDIKTGVLEPGDILPTHRELADDMGIAIGTVTRAYIEAEQRGLVHGQGRRGTFVGQARKDHISFYGIGRNAPGAIDLSLNLPIYAEDPDLQAALKAISRKPQIPHLLHFSDPGRDDRHRQAGKAWLNDCGVQVPAEDVILTNGAQHATSTVLTTLMGPGDTIAAAALTFPGIKSIAAVLNLRMAGIQMDKDGLIPEDFEALCRRRKIRALYCVPTLQNPTNCTIPLARRRELVQIAQQYDILILEDDVHRRLLEPQIPTLYELAPEHTCYISSMGKMVAAGLRAGFLVAPKALQQEINNTLQAGTWMASPLPLEVFLYWQEEGIAQATIARKRKEAYLRQELAREILGPFYPSGQSPSYYVWFTLPPEWPISQFAVEALKAGVAVATADSFLTESRFMVNAIRICLGAAETRSSLKAGLKIIRRLLESKPGQQVMVM